MNHIDLFFNELICLKLTERKAVHNNTIIAHLYNFSFVEFIEFIRFNENVFQM